MQFAADAATALRGAFDMNHPIIRAAIGGLTLSLLWAGQALAAPPADPIPEPASLALLALGIGGVAWMKFRRKK
jgi:hypothetical protein